MITLSAFDSLTVVHIACQLDIDLQVARLSFKTENTSQCVFNQSECVLKQEGERFMSQRVSCSPSCWGSFYSWRFLMSSFGKHPKNTAFPLSLSIFFCSQHERTGEFTQTQEELGDGGKRNHHEYKYRERERENWKVSCSSECVFCLCLEGHLAVIIDFSLSSSFSSS